MKRLRDEIRLGRSVEFGTVLFAAKTVAIHVRIVAVRSGRDALLRVRTILLASLRIEQPRLGKLPRKLAAGLRQAHATQQLSFEGQDCHFFCH